MADYSSSNVGPKRISMRAFDVKKMESTYELQNAPPNSSSTTGNFNSSEHSDWQMRGKFFCQDRSCFNISIKCHSLTDCGKDPKCLAADSSSHALKERHDGSDIKVANATKCVAKLTPTNISMETILANTQASLFVLNATRLAGSAGNTSAVNQSGVIIIASSLSAADLAKAADEIRAFLAAGPGTWVPKSSSGMLELELSLQQEEYPYRLPANVSRSRSRPGMSMEM
jgi:hypothetical protein